jgi:hypothetical protein
VTRVTLLVNSDVFRHCPACARKGCECRQQSRRIFVELAEPAAYLEENLTPEQRRPADGYVAFGGDDEGVITIWEVE